MSDMDLEVRHLKLIQAIAEEGSVTGAGGRLHLTQSALSHQLRDIESRLGSPLFLRLNKRMALTPAGERLLKSARTILDHLKVTEEEIRRLGADTEGVLRIAVECYTCYHWLPSLLAMRSFREKYRRVEVRILAEATRRPLDWLLEGKLDLAIVSGAPRDRRLLQRPLFQDELVAVMRPDHPLASRPHLRPADFADQHLLIYSTPEENIFMQRLLLPAGIVPAKVTQVQLTEAIVELVKAGLGISVLATWAVAPQVESGALAARPLTRQGLRRQWSAARLRGQSAPAYLLEFEELLAADPLSLRRGAAAQRRVVAAGRL
jgi:LysR family transcriptional regulator, regulator for metE and metH